MLHTWQALGIWRAASANQTLYKTITMNRLCKYYMSRSTAALEIKTFM